MKELLTWIVLRDNENTVAGFTDRSDALEYIKNQDFTFYSYTLKYLA